MPEGNHFEGKHGKQRERGERERGDCGERESQGWRNLEEEYFYSRCGGFEIEIWRRRDRQLTVEKSWQERGWTTCQRGRNNLIGEYLLLGVHFRYLI